MRNTYAVMTLIRGKPVLQTMGQELTNGTSPFSFDETSRAPEADGARLVTAYQARTRRLSSMAPPMAAGGSWSRRWSWRCRRPRVPAGSSASPPPCR